jgi:hypothetical protein
LETLTIDAVLIFCEPTEDALRRPWQAIQPGNVRF